MSLNLEIERKFLVNPKLFSLPREYITIHQAYLLITKDREVRVRIINGNCCTLGLKINASRGRLEYEQEIPREHAMELMNHRLPHTNIINKVRYSTTYATKVWTVDFFGGLLHDLCLAEVELKNKDEKLIMPPWACTEVTDRQMFKNANLAFFKNENFYFVNGFSHSMRFL